MSETRKFDRVDSRVREDEGLIGAPRGFVSRVRSGVLGVLPVIVGLAVSAVVSTSLKPVFMRPQNFTDVLFGLAAVGLISLGGIFVLLLGGTDLSIGSISGVAAAILGVLRMSTGIPRLFAVLAAGVATGFPDAF